MRIVVPRPCCLRPSLRVPWLVSVFLLGWTAVLCGQTSVTGRVGDGAGAGVAGVSVSLGGGLSAVTDAGGDYTIVDVPAGEYEARATAPGYVFLPSVRVVGVPDAVTGVNFTATAIGAGVPIPGSTAIYLAGRDDVGIPAVGADLTGSGFPFDRVCYGYCLGFLQEQGPWQTATLASERFQFTAWGGVDYYGGTDTVAGPDGYPDSPSAVEALAGISAYNGPAGALVGVFLDDLNPGSLAAPAALDFSAAGLGTGFAALEPILGQVFFIGDGRGADGVIQTFTAPWGATRLCVGIADAGNFSGSPGTYDDDQGAFVVTLQRLGAVVTGMVASAGSPLAGVTVSLGAGLTGVTDAAGAYVISDVPAGSHVATASLAGYIFMPPQRDLGVPPDVSGIDFTAYATAGGTVVPGSTVVYLAGRLDLSIPDLGVDPVAVGFPFGRNCTAPPTAGFVKEALPLQVAVVGGEGLTFAATGAVDYYGGIYAAVGPDGDSGGTGSIDSLGGVSGYQGPNGALVGVFLDDGNPASAAPPATLDFTPAGLGSGFTALAPALGQVFYIGDGTTTVAGDAVVFHQFTAPAGATRLFIGIADAFNFGGPPGAYDDNIGAFVVRMQRSVYSVGGTVTTATGGTLAGVTVSLGAGLSAVTDAFGEYVISVPAGSYEATVSLTGYTFAPGSRALSVPPSSSAVDFVATPVPAEYTISGWVTAGGVGLGGARVAVAGLAAGQTNVNGRYGFTGLPAGSYRVYPEPMSGYVFTPPQRLVTVPPDAAYSVSFEAVPTAGGTVVPGSMAIYLAGRDEVSIPAVGVAPAAVGFPLGRDCVGECPGAVQEQFPASFTVTAGEWFSFSAWGGADYYGGTVGFAGPDGYTDTDSAVAALGGISAYNGPAGSLVGVFLEDANPGPLPAPLALDFAATGLGTSFPVLAPGLGQVFFIGDGRGAGDAVQRFVAPLGATRLFIGVADAPDFSGAPGAYDDNLGSLLVALSRLSSPIGGTVTVAGLGVAGILVTLGPAQETYTDAAGSYAFANVPPGDYTVTPLYAGHLFEPATRVVTVPPAATGIDFDGAPAVAVDGHVREPDGAPIAGVDVLVNGEWAATTDPDGSFALRTLPGLLTFAPAKTGYVFRPPQTTVPLDAGESFTLDFQGCSRVIRGRVLAEGGAPVASVQVSAGVAGSTETDTQGEYEFYDVPAGSYAVTATAVGRLLLPPQRVVAVPPLASPVDFTAYATAGGAVIPGAAAVFLAGRTDLTIPALGLDPATVGFPLGRNCTAPPTDGFVEEAWPLQVAVHGGEELSFTATGAVDYYGGTTAAFGPDGDPSGVGSIDSLGGLSGYQGPNGALVGVFLDDTNPRDAAPPATLDFTAGGLSPSFTTLAPGLRQLFFVGNGSTTGAGPAGVTQEFTVPAGATRLCLGIADGFDFGGAPGAYDDNIGAFVVSVQRRVYSVSGTVTASTGGGLAGVTVSLGAGLMAVTHVDGTYVIAGVPAGLPTATPTLSGYEFVPAQRALSVPPSVSGVDFVGTPAAARYDIGGWVMAGAVPLHRVVVTGAGIAATMTDVSGYYLLSGVPAGSYRVFPEPTADYLFVPPQRLVTVPPAAASSVSFEAIPTAGGTLIPGPMAIYLAGRDDLTIPPSGVDPAALGFPLTRVCIGGCMGYLQERFPALFAVTAGEHLQFAASGGVDYYDGTADTAAPDGYPESSSGIDALAGISGYNGPRGALVGVFLTSANPASVSAPPALDFSSAGLGTGFTALAPVLGQVFFIGDGNGAGGTVQTFTPPAGATRLFVGTADAYGFFGAPGTYDDNIGAFLVTVNHVAPPVTHRVTYRAGSHGRLDGVAVQTVFDGGSTPPVNAVAAAR